MEHINSSLLFILGLGVFGGLIGAWIFQKIHFPQVVGYIVIGLILGEAGFGIITAQEQVTLRVFNFFALGVIGFLVGGELKLEAFRKYGRQFLAILLGEGLLAFMLVGVSTAMLLYLVTPNLAIAMAGGVVFGAIASATDPASTVDVLWEYRSQGVMTTALIAIIALDDALAMTLYGVGTALAQIVTGGGGSVAHELWIVFKELFGAIGLGLAGSIILSALMRWVKQQDRAVAMAIGMILLVISITVAMDMDVILAGMTMGFVLTNISPYRSEDLFKLTRSFSIPIYVLFFVLVGARLDLGLMPWWIWALVILYVLGRSGGKVLGAWLGAKWSGSPPTVRKYLGMSLFAQGGVAVGLSIVAAQRLSNITIVKGVSLGDAIVFTITATTLIVQLIGPSLVKISIRLAGEIGRDITEDDVMEEMKVADVVNEHPLLLRDSDSLSKAVELFRDHDLFIYPVVDASEHLVGVLSFDDLKSVLADRDTWEWLLSADVMTPVIEHTTMSSPLTDVYNRMVQMKFDQIPVVDEKDPRLPVGILDIRTIRVRTHAELIRRRSGGTKATEEIKLPA